MTLRLPTYAIHGLVVSSDVPLPGATGEAGGEPDLHIARGEYARAPEDAELLCEIPIPGAGTYLGYALADRYLLTYSPAFAFSLSRDLTRMTWWAAEADEAHVGQLLVGNAMAFALQLMGVSVLHASAVDTTAGVIAIAGPPGAGKSTLAGLLCESGGTLVTDDMLRVDVGEHEVVCHPGSRTLRLRRQARALAARLGGPPPFTTFDGRVGVRLEAPTHARRLDRVLFPVFDVDSAAPVLRHLHARAALVALLGVPRWFGWRVPGPQRVQFRAMAGLAERVPVYELRMPFYDEPPAGVRAQVLDALR